MLSTADCLQCSRVCSKNACSLTSPALLLSAVLHTPRACEAGDKEPHPKSTEQTVAGGADKGVNARSPAGVDALGQLINDDLPYVFPFRP